MSDDLKEAEGAEKIGAPITDDMTVTSKDGNTVTTLGAVLLTLGLVSSGVGVYSNLPDKKTADYKEIVIASIVKPEAVISLSADTVRSVDAEGRVSIERIDPARTVQQESKVVPSYSNGTDNVKMSFLAGQKVEVIVKVDDVIARQGTVTMNDAPTTGDKWGMSIPLSPIPLNESTDW